MASCWQNCLFLSMRAPLGGLSRIHAQRPCQDQAQLPDPTGSVSVLAWNALCPHSFLALSLCSPGNRTRDFPKHKLNFPAPKPLFLPHPPRTTFLIQTPPSLQDPAPQRPPRQPGQKWSQPPLQPGPSGLPRMGPITPCIHHPVVGCVLVFSPNSPHRPPWGKTQIIHVCVPAPHLRTLASLCNCQSPFVHR